mmetsp:Transcript_34716/g.81351  ORF Transcript_34716/g.81351 Transcript_34716/m.81351 type:complete len:80 (-) Transcript_34716:9-248(-)
MGSNISMSGGPSLPLIMMAPAVPRSIGTAASGFAPAMRELESCDAAKAGTYAATAQIVSAKTKNLIEIAILDTHSSLSL